MPDVHTLRVFLAVAQKLSVTRAGETLGLTQSAVSHQISKLEGELRVGLFDRQGRSITLTRAGHELIRYADEIVNRVDALGDIVRAAASDATTGTLRIGATIAACQYLLPDPIREFRECFPGYAVNVLPGDSPVIVDWVEAGQADLGMVICGDHTRKLELRPLFQDQLGLVFHPLHRLAACKRITAGDLFNEHWVTYSRGSATFMMVDRHLAKLRVSMSNPIELGSIEAIKELVKMGLGISVLARWAVRSDIEAGSLVWKPLPGPRLRRDWAIALPPGRSLRLAEESLVELCRTSAGNLMLGENDPLH